MKPDDLAFAIYVELIVVAWSAIDLVYVTYVRLSLSQRVGKTSVEVRGEHCANEATHDEIGKNLVPAADPVDWTQQIQKDTFAELSGNKQVFDREWEIFGEAVCARKKPVEPVKPGFPF
jgi:hypothetical protein